MRRTGVFALGLVALVLLGASVFLYSKYRKSEAAYAQVTAEEEQTRIRYGQAINEIATIQDSLNAIVLGDEAGRLLPARPGTEVQLPPTLRDQIFDRIAILKAGLERTKDRIQELDTRLRKSGVKMAGLEKIIAGLRRKVTEKEQMIAQLDTQVDSLEVRVAGLSVEVGNQEREIEDKRHELATIFYTMGKKKELIRSGVVVAKGGVLGIGKTLKPSGQFNESFFTAMDTDQENVIRIPAQKVQVLSPQPVTSYALQPAGEGLVELRILDAKEFRKVKHLVILMA